MKAGFVSLVGAGPGDPGLITVKGLDCIRQAEVIIFDRLVDSRLLEYASDSAELIDVGKIPGETVNTQDAINSTIVSKAFEGQYVVRLKGGDPFVFGRGGEEAEFLQDKGIPFEIVPGITSAIAAPAYAGIPVTHRSVSSAVTFVTGSEDPSKPDTSVDWASLARSGNTLVVLMGWRALPAITKVLIENGRPSTTPVALVQWGTRPEQRSVTGTLENIYQTARQEGLRSPLVTVIGDVVNLREKLRWFDNRPLFGKRVLVTRTRSQAGKLSTLLSAKGARAIEVPAIEITPPADFSELDGALQSVQNYNWMIFTSVNAVRVVFERLVTLDRDSRALYGTSIAAIGPATAAALNEHGISPDFVPDSFVSEAVVKGLASKIRSGDTVLLPRADVARDALRDGLVSLGADVREITAYHTVTPSGPPQALEDSLAEGVDVATFTSSSTVTNLLKLLDGRTDALSGVTIACIGPITAATANEAGLRVDIVAAEYTIQGLVDALEAHFEKERS